MNIKDFQPHVLEFFAESELIEVVPNFKGDQLHLISGDFGPFRSGIPINIPLWLALYLKKRSQCKINPPLWLDTEFLSNKLAEEKRLVGEYAELVFYFEEISNLLLKNASDDIKNSTKVKGLIEDILNIRASKMQEKIASLKPTDDYLSLRNITNMEINKSRRMIEETMTTMNRIKSLGDPKDIQTYVDTESTQTQQTQ